MKKFLKHVQSCILRGFFAIIPLFLCVVAVQLLYNLIDKKVIGLLNKFVEVRQIPGLGILLLLVSLYLLGMIVSNFIGKRFFGLLENLTTQIPIIKTIYGVGKQVAQSLNIANEENKTFKRAVLVNIDPNKSIWAPAFVTGELIDQRTQEKMLMVLVPTAPTPASGFVLAVKESQVYDPGWTIEECLKTVVSVGIITPKRG